MPEIKKIKTSSGTEYDIQSTEHAALSSRIDKIAEVEVETVRKQGYIHVSLDRFYYDDDAEAFAFYAEQGHTYKRTAGSTMNKSFIGKVTTESSGGADLSNVQRMDATVNEWTATFTGKAIWYCKSSADSTLASTFKITTVGDLTLSQLSGEIGELQSATVNRAINLIDKSKCVMNKLQNGATPSDNSSYYITDMIPIDATKQYTATVPVLDNESRTYGNNHPYAGFRFAAYFDSSKTFISAESGDASGAATVIFPIVPSNAAYVVLTFYKNNQTKYPMLVEGHFTSWVEYVEYGVIRKKTELEDVDGLAGNGKNLLDSSKLVNGFLCDCYIAQSSSYKTTDFIPVKAGKTYAMSPSARWWQMYDCNKNATGNVTTNSSEVGNPTFTPTVDGYIRLSFSASNTNLQFEEGSTPTAYEPFSKQFGCDLMLNDAQIADAHDRLNIPEDIEATIPMKHGVNLFDAANTVTGAITSSGLQTGGVWDGYKTSDYISLVAGSYVIRVMDESLLTATSSNNRILYVLYENDSDTVIGSYNTDNVNNVEVIASSDCRIRLSVRDFNAKRTMLTAGTTLYPYEAYYEYPAIFDNQYFGNALNGKKWVACGDSFTHGSYNVSDGFPETDYLFQDGSRFRNWNKTYPMFIADRNNMMVKNIAQGGMTLATPASGDFHNTFSESLYQTVDEDVDYITIYLGINDSGHRTGSGTTQDGEVATGVIPLGTIDDTTNTTFCGAWNVVLEWLITNRPFAHIGIIVSNGAGADYVNATIAAAKKWGVAYLNLDGDYQVPMMHRTYTRTETSNEAKNLRMSQFRVSETNTHPNTAAHEYQSYFIENWLRSL